MNNKPTQRTHLQNGKKENQEFKNNKLEMMSKEQRKK